MTINIDDINTYFSLFGNEKSIHTVCFMDKASEKPLVGWGCFHGTLDEIVYNLERLVGNEEGEIGATLHLCLNETDLKGRKKGNIVRARVLAVDIDTVISRETLKILVEAWHPHIVIESSLGKFHLYWRLASGINLELWSKLQLAIACLMPGGDRCLDEVTKTLRVPGVQRVCKDGSEFMPSVVLVSQEFIDGQSIDLSNLAQCIPPMKAWNKAYELGFAARKEDRKRLGKELAVLNGGMDWREGKETHLNGPVHTLETGRNSTIYTAIKDAVYHGKVEGEESAIIAGRHLNSQLEVPLDEREAEITSIKAFNSGFEARERAAVKRKESLVAKLGGVDMANGEAIEHVNGVINGVDKSEAGSDEDLLEQCARKPEFEYNYEAVDLKINRFSDAAIAERVVQRFPNALIKCGKITYTFNEKTLLWEVQSPMTGGHSLMDYYARTCINDTVNDVEFIKEHAMSVNKNGEAKISISKLKNAEKVYLSNGKKDGTVRAMFDHPTTPKKLQTDFDKDNEIIYMNNGVLDLRTLELRDAKATDYLFNRSPINWDNNADYSWWLEFLGQVFADNAYPEDMTRFIQDIFASSITGDVTQEHIYVHFGDSCNGKSKVLRALGAILGLGHYASTLSSDTLVKEGGKGLSKEFDRIGVQAEGKRVLIVDDLSNKTVWNDGLIKTLTNDRLSSRPLYGEVYHVTNHAKFHVCCNHTPKINVVDGGLERRIVIIPYDRKFEKVEAMSRLINKNIELYAPGIFRWAVEGFQRLYSNKYKIEFPLEVADSIKQYTEETIPENHILSDMYEVPQEGDKESIWVKIQDLAQEVQAKLVVLGQDPTGFQANRVSRELQKLGFKKKRLSRHEDIKKPTMALIKRKNRE